MSESGYYIRQDAAYCPICGVKVGYYEKWVGITLKWLPTEVSILVHQSCIEIKSDGT